ncbi:MAG: DUF2399 domain-containing protein [Acidimicrobiales bacterium]|nr:DUF2399 domain-containing protein [Acidimicrobiales bacterium]
MSAPVSLHDDHIAPLWQAVRHRLERRGAHNRGRLRLPTLDSQGRLVLKGLLGRQPGITVDLGVLEGALVRLGVGSDLADALAHLGHPISDAPEAQRQRHRLQRAAREAARAEAVRWPEPWTEEWIDETIRAGVLRGFDPEAAVTLIRQVRDVLDTLDHGGRPLSRNELAAQVCGSAHALDPGTRLEAAATRALVKRSGPAHDRELWTAAGAHLDLTSAPALTWNLPLADSPLATTVRAATEAGLPVHLTRFALERFPAVTAALSTSVLVVENPRLVEAAAQSVLPLAVLATNGQPSSTVTLLVHQLIGSGGSLHCHADFDPAGLAICSRLAEGGVSPWHMTATHYRTQVRDAERSGVDLPETIGVAPPTPWDPALSTAVTELRRAVHEERLLPDLLDQAVSELE